MPMTSEEILTLAAPWTAPISDAAPSGVSAKEDERYLAVTTEIARLDSPTTETIRWKSVWRAVISQGGDLLREKSKDLFIASQVAYAMYRQDNLQGLLQGVALLTALIENFWLTLFPELKRIRGRAVAVQWFLDKTEGQLKGYTPAPGDGETLEDLAVAIARFDRSAREKYGDSTPSISRLRELVEALRFEAGPLRAQHEALPMTPWSFDSSNTSLELFIMSYASGQRLRGQFGSFRGRIYLPDEVGAKTCGFVMTIDVASLSMANAALRQPLLSSEFLDAASFPTASCAVSGEQTGTHGGGLAGELTLRGRTGPVTLKDFSVYGSKTLQGRERLCGGVTLDFADVDFGLARNPPVTAGGAVFGQDETWTLLLQVEAFRAR